MLSPASLMVLALVVACASALLVGLVRRHALRTDLLDLPSARGSHQQPTPRGGGLGVVAAALGGVVVVLATQPAPPMVRLLASLGGVALVAVVGWLDDRASLPVFPRLLAHLAAGAIVAWYAAGVAGPFHSAGVVAVLWWLLWTVAMINVTNFMDGIDGLIAGQMVVWGGALVAVTGGQGIAAVLGTCIAGSAAGFLGWNWAPARIFLGDVGSGALGVLAVIGGIAAVRESGLAVELVFLPLLPMFLDASTTLVSRAARGARLWEAHREHLYQRLAAAGWGHARVALLYAVTAALGVPVSLVDTSFRATAAGAYVLAVAGLGGWLHLRAQAASRPG